MDVDLLLLTNTVFYVLGLKALEVDSVDHPSLEAAPKRILMKVVIGLASFVAVGASFFALPWYLWLGIMIGGTILGLMLRVAFHFLRIKAFIAFVSCLVSPLTAALIVMSFYD